jgi:hypothetical protein
MQSTIIRPENPHDFSEEDVDDLKRHLAVEAAEADFVVDLGEERGYGVNLYEVVQVVADVRGAGGDYVIAGLLLWMRKRWKRDKDRSGQPRPRSVIVLDEDGKVVRSYDIDEPDGEPRQKAKKHDEDDD